MSPRSPSSRLEWFATPPGGTRHRYRRPTRRQYTGPPGYPTIPRWGFPLVSWRWPLALPRRSGADPLGPDPMQRVLSLAATAVSTLWFTVAVAGLAAVGEAWRYVLLMISRDESLSRVTVTVSDVLVMTAGILLGAFGVLAGLVVVLWALRARQAAAERAETTNARPDWQLVAGVLIPGWNLFVPGSMLAELEHTVLLAEGERAPGRRPRPSRVVLLWWAAWMVNQVLGWVTLLWSSRGGVQAMADGVELHMWTDLAVVALALVTLRVVNRVTRLLVPVDPESFRYRRVLEVRNAPRPARVSRPATAPR